MVGVGPAHALPSTCLQKVEEQPEDTDNQRNVTRMGSQPLDPSATVQVPVMRTGPPGETTVVPSEYLPGTSGAGPPCAASSRSPFSPALWQLFSQLENKLFAVTSVLPCAPEEHCDHHLPLMPGTRWSAVGTAGGSVTRALAGALGSSGRQTTPRSRPLRVARRLLRTVGMA